MADIELVDIGPQAWSNLISAITLLAKGQSNDISPFHCEHDTLTVMADPKAFTDAELAQLDEWGFIVEDEAFVSFRYGSA